MNVMQPYSAKILIVFFWLLPNFIFSQIKIVNDKDGLPVPYAHIFLDNVYHTYSDENGDFVLSDNVKFDTLKISHLTFQSQSVAYTDLKAKPVIRVEEKTIALNEVAINVKRGKIRAEVLLPEKSIIGHMGRGHDIQLVYETGNVYGQNPDAVKVARAIYIPNEGKFENSLITKIILKSVDKQIEGDKTYIPFLVNLMTYDTVTKLPKDKIFEEDLHVGKKRGQEIIIDLSREEAVPFPKEGICVVVSVYRTEHYIHNGFNSPPKFEAVALKKSSGFREYFSYDSHAWQEQPYSVRREQCFNFGVEVEYRQ